MDASERRARATQEAAQWWSRLGTKRPNEIPRAEREQLTQWLRESPLHVAELLHIAHVHDALERFRLWGEIETAGAMGDEANVTPLRPGADERSGDPARPLRRRISALAASLCAVAVALAWLVLGYRGEVMETERAERRQLMLSDGSVVQLEPETSLRVHLDAHERRVTLERGRALFRVAKDPRRPFRVRADRTWVRAIGTAFGVEQRRGGVIVTVSEGRVAVSSEEEVSKGVVAAVGLLTAGQQLTVRQAGAAQSVRVVDTSRALAWAQGRLVFENDTLANVISEFNRYNHTQLRIDDTQLAARRVSGVFEATDTETLLAFIQAGSRVSIARGDEVITISPGRSP